MRIKQGGFILKISTCFTIVDYINERSIKFETFNSKGYFRMIFEDL